MQNPTTLMTRTPFPTRWWTVMTCLALIIQVS
jgi:hypothetical protein